MLVVQRTNEEEQLILEHKNAVSPNVAIPTKRFGETLHTDMKAVYHEMTKFLLTTSYDIVVVYLIVCYGKTNKTKLIIKRHYTPKTISWNVTHAMIIFHLDIVNKPSNGSMLYQ